MYWPLNNIKKTLLNHVVKYKKAYAWFGVSQKD